MKYVIGIDSGGTHIVGQALTDTGKILEESKSGPGNILLDKSQTLINLEKVLSDLLSKLNIDDCQYILIGIAGVEITDNAKEVSAIISNKFGIKTFVIGDAKLALLNGLEGQDGTLVISGTGSVVYGRQRGKSIRFGGWGNLLGDTGSAYQITSVAMKEMLYDYDYGQKSELEDILLIELKASSVQEAVRNFYTLNRKEIASIAVKIAHAANDGNTTAIKVLEDQANALAEEILGLFSQYSHQIPNKIAFSGSVLVHNDFFRKIILNRIRKEYPDLKPITVNTNNARGAIFWNLWNRK